MRQITQVAKKTLVKHRFFKEKEGLDWKTSPEGRRTVPILGVCGK